VPELSRFENWYRAPRWLENPHVHTIFGSLYRRAPRVRYERRILPTEDGGSLALDILEDFDGGGAGAQEEAPPRDWVLLVSGLGGGSEDSYVQSMAAAAARRGYGVAVLNMRGCGGSPVTSPRFFSAMRGSVDDMRLAVRYVRGRLMGGGGGGGGGTLSAIGWSNGATIVNNYAALQARPGGAPDARIDAAATLCCPFDMPAADRGFRRPFSRLVYDRALARRLVSAVRGNLRAFRDRDAVRSLAGRRVDLDLDRLLRARTVRDIDAELTCKIFDYPSVDAYYADSSSGQRLGDVEIPMLLVSAMDDPLAPGHTIPFAEAVRNENLILAATRRGGHLGWIPDRPCADGGRWTAEWTEQSVMNYLDSCRRAAR